MKRYTHSPKHPDVVAGLNDAAALRGLVASLESHVDELTTAISRRGVMYSIQVLNGLIKALETSP